MRKPPQQTRRRQRRHQPRQRARAHFSENHALIFLAIVQPFYSSKPYHKSLHSCSLSLSHSISISSTRTSGFGVYRSDCFSSRAVPLASQPGKKTKENGGESRMRSLIFLRFPPSSVKTVLSRLRRRGSLLLCITSDERVFAFMM